MKMKNAEKKLLKEVIQLHTQRKNIYASSPKSQIRNDNPTNDLELNDSQDVFNLSKANDLSPRMGTHMKKGGNNTSLDYSDDGTPRNGGSLKKETMNIQEERKTLTLDQRLEQINEEDDELEQTQMMAKDYAEKEFDVLEPGQKELQQRKTINSENEAIKKMKT